MMDHGLEAHPLAASLSPGKRPGHSSLLAAQVPSLVGRPRRRKPFPHVAGIRHLIPKGAQHHGNSVSVLGGHSALGSSERSRSFNEIFSALKSSDGADGTELEIFE